MAKIYTYNNHNVIISSQYIKVDDKLLPVIYKRGFTYSCCKRPASIKTENVNGIIKLFNGGSCWELFKSTLCDFVLKYGK